MIGEILNARYRITRLLGEGGMGSVYEADDQKSGGRVAVKVLLPDKVAKSESLVRRFHREARAAGSIATPHIARVLDTGIDPDNGRPFMVMEYLHGEDLQQLLKRVGAIHPDTALRIVAQALVGLAAAHEANIVHRDIKPANIFLDEGDGEKVTVKVVDFGVAKIRVDALDTAETAGLTRTGALLGSPLYMSPEQARGSKDLDQRADLWSMGVVLYQTLAGRTPLQHIDALGELIFTICTQPPQLVQDFAPWVPPEVANVVHTALRYDTAERYPTAKAMLAALDALLPRGRDLTKDMLVAAGTEVRGQTARRLALTQSMPGAAPPPTRPPAPSGSEAAASLPSHTPDPGTSSPALAGTNQGVSQSRAPLVRDPAPASRVPMMLAGLIALGGGGAAAYLLLGGQAPAGPPAATAAIAPDPPAPPAASAPATGVEGAPAGSAPSASAVASGAPSASAAASASAATSATAAAIAKPTTTVAPKATGPGPKPTATAKPIDTSAFGDRK